MIERIIDVLNGAGIMVPWQLHSTLLILTCYDTHKIIFTWANILELSESAGYFYIL